MISLIFNLAFASYNSQSATIIGYLFFIYFFIFFFSFISFSFIFIFFYLFFLVYFRDYWRDVGEAISVIRWSSRPFLPSSASSSSPSPVPFLSFPSSLFLILTPASNILPFFFPFIFFIILSFPSLNDQSGH